MPIATSPPTGMTAAQKAITFYCSQATAELSNEVILNTMLSDTLVHSHDALVSSKSNASYEVLKTITLNIPIEKVRVKWTMIIDTGVTAKTKIYKNGVALGSEHTTTVNNTVESEDLTFSGNANDTLELWGYRSAGINKYGVHSFRLYATWGNSDVGVNS